MEEEGLARCKISIQPTISFEVRTIAVTNFSGGE